ncbi:maleylpyruvate isomerase family mycothiol-dependent enzyme [Pseudonocardia yuanmonensis]|uniref:Maleylpyruvate isomerase family mycothiol-dependent enzyme n=1 Tax=Pseudonocardia yuanmonensis TaxID=1095914 RepID=A0ABP8WSW6_9PSEU
MTRTGRPDYMAMAMAERAEITDLLASLTPEQWKAPTLCEDWRVRDVVAHMFSYDELGTIGLIRRFARGRFTRGGPNALGLADYADRSPDELVALARAHQRPRGLTAGFGGRIALTDGTIHHQDIRRPLGLPRHLPAERLAVVLEFARTAPTIGARKRIRGLTLTATDLDWTTGEGPEVSGPGEALLMALAGRRGITGDLSGPGLPELAERIGG